MALARTAGAIADKFDRFDIALGAMELIGFLLLLCAMGGRCYHQTGSQSCSARWEVGVTIRLAPRAALRDGR